jgi:hypothetical protein
MKAPAYALAHAFTPPNTLLECKIGPLLSSYAYRGGMPPGVSKLISIAKYRDFDYGMSRETTQ